MQGLHVEDTASRRATGMSADHPGPAAIQANTVEHIGCCGAYCGACRALLDLSCRGCKLGYSDGSRSISAARCRMKVCCLDKGLQACTDCAELDTCRNIGEFFGKNGYKYRKYRESTEFIRANGHAAFLAQACCWQGAYGRLNQPGTA